MQLLVDLPQLLTSLYVYGQSYEQIESLQEGGEVTLNQAIISSQTSDISWSSDSHCNYIYFFFFFNKISLLMKKANFGNRGLKHRLVRIFSMSLIQVCLRFIVIPMLLILCSETLSSEPQCLSSWTEICVARTSLNWQCLLASQQTGTWVISWESFCDRLAFLRCFDVADKQYQIH